MDNSIELLQKQLQEKIERLDKERAEQQKAHDAEQAQRRIIEAADREERVKAIKEQEAALAKRKADIEAAEAQRQKVALESQIKSDNLANEQQELVRRQREKLEWLEKAISDAEFVEEQHKKSMDNTKLAPVEHTEAVEGDVNAHILTGEAAKDTDGLEVGPDMSSHLKSILRRANSYVN